MLAQSLSKISLLTICLGFAMVAQADPSFSITELSNIGSNQPNSLGGVNDSGTVASNAFSSSDGYGHAAYFNTTGTSNYLPTLASNNSVASSISDTGYIGGSQIVDGGLHSQAAYWSSTTGTEQLVANEAGATTFNDSLLAANNSGVFAGQRGTTGFHVTAIEFNSATNTATDLTATGASDTFAYGINNSDTTVGVAKIGGVNTAYVWSANGTGTALANLTGRGSGGQSFAEGINDAGLIVGSSLFAGTYIPVYWDASGGIHTIDTSAIPGFYFNDNNGHPFGPQAWINDAGNMVFAGLNGLNPGGLYVTQGVGYNLDTLLSSQYKPNNVFGGVVGLSSNGNFLLATSNTSTFAGSDYLVQTQAVPEPKETFLLLGVGLIALLKVRKR